MANELNCPARVWPLPLSYICPFAIMWMSDIEHALCRTLVPRAAVPSCRSETYNAAEFAANADQHLLQLLERVQIFLMRGAGSTSSSIPQ
jgi:hypothetical protein